MDAIGTIGHDVAAWVVNAIANHPTAAGWIFVVFWIATCVMTIIRALYPQYETRPPWARAVVEVLDPLAGNVWRVLAWGLKKVGIVIRTPMDPPAQADPGAPKP